jgi:hypothetical protein
LKTEKIKLSFCLFLIFFIFSSCGITKENEIIVNDKIINGEFEEELAIGWQKVNKDYVGYNSIKLLGINKNNYANVKKVMCGYAELFQIIKLDNLNQNLSVRLNLNAYANRQGYTATSAFTIAFLDEENNVIAETRIAYSPAGLSNTPTLYHHQVKSKEWKNHTINLKQEIDRFSKIDPSQIVKLKIALYAYGSNTQGC